MDTSIFEGPLALSVFETTELWGLGRVPQPLGSTNRTAAPNQAFKARDGYLNICAANQRLWARLCSALGRDDLTDDPRFATNDDRMSHRQDLETELERTLAARPAQEWVDLLLAAGVPAGPIHDYAQVFADPQTQARQMMVEMDHPVEGRIRGLGIPVKLSETPGSVRRAAPLLAEHTEQVLADLGYSHDDIRALRDKGVV